MEMGHGGSDDVPQIKQGGGEGHWQALQDHGPDAQIQGPWQVPKSQGCEYAFPQGPGADPHSLQTTWPSWVSRAHFGPRGCRCGRMSAQHGSSRQCPCQCSAGGHCEFDGLRD